MTTKNDSKEPEAFISYSYDSPEHVEWVNYLVLSLRNNGVNAISDEFIPYGHDLHLYMERIREADFVPIICTPDYAVKADNRTGGVGIETFIITAEIYQKENEGKFIPIIRSGTAEKSLPTYLQGKKFIDWRDDKKASDNLKKLLRTILRVPLTPLPEIGPNPFLGPNPDPEIVFLSREIDSNLSAYEKSIGDTEENIEVAKEYSEMWPMNSPLWNQFLGKEIFIVYGSWPRDKNISGDIGTANILRTFFEKYSKGNAKVVWWKELENEFVRKPDQVIINIGGPLSNKFTEASGTRFKGELIDRKYPQITDQISGKKFESRLKNMGTWIDYATLQCGRLFNAQALFLWGNYHYGALELVRHLTDPQAYFQLFKNERFDFSRLLTQDWLFQVTMESRYGKGIKQISTHYY